MSRLGSPRRERSKRIRAIKDFLKEQRQKGFKHGPSVSKEYNKDYFLLEKVIGNKPCN